MAPPPTISASGSKVLIIWSKNSPSACAWTRKMSRHIASPRSARPRTLLAASLTSSVASSWPGYFCRNAGSSVLRIAVSEHTDSRSPTRPQLHCGTTSSRPGDPLRRDQHVAALAAESGAAGDDPAIDDHAAAQAGADDRGDRCRGRPAEDVEVAPQRARVAVIEITDRALQADRQVARQVEPGPLRDARSWSTPSR